VRKSSDSSFDALMKSFLQKHVSCRRYRAFPPQNRSVPLIHQLRHPPKLKNEENHHEKRNETLKGATPLTYSQGLDFFQRMLALSHVCRGSHGTGCPDRLHGEVSKIAEKDDH
jgi:hypothetical protein